MKLAILGIIVITATTFALQRGSGPASTETVKVRGCLAGNGSDASPWVLRGAVLPSPPAPAPAGPPPGARGDGARGDGGRGGAGRGGDGRGAAPAAAAPAPPPQPPVDLKLADIDMTPWRNLYVEVEGTLGPRPASGLRELRVNAARSAYGDCR